MKEDRFIKENSAAWMDMEAVLRKLKARGYRKFEKNELDSFIVLYNRVCGHLSYSRTCYGSAPVTTYLNRLVATAHSFIYTSKKSSLKTLWYFFTTEFPMLVRNNWFCMLLSSGLLISGILFSFIFTMLSPDNATAFLPQSMLDSFSLDGQSGISVNSSLLSSFIFTNNIRVGFMVFALGLTLGIGTAWVAVSNGFILGALAAIAQRNGSGIRFWSLILPHGVLELFALFVCGASGLIIGYSLINPGIYSRKDSLIIKGKVGIKLVIGTIPIFVLAGLIEGFITPMAIPDTVKLGFALLTLLLLAAYLIIPSRRSKPQS
jgi:uncharacterized membrane protein SpoIIM required for sporulation